MKDLVSGEYGVEESTNETLSDTESTGTCLRPYQEMGINFLVERKGGLLFDEMGLGKTRTALETLKSLNCKKVLVVCTKMASYVWVEEVEKWLGIPSFVLKNPIKVTDLMEVSQHEAFFLIINYWQLEFFMQQCGDGLTFDAVVFDEGHILRHKENKTFALSRQLVRDIQHRIIMTGTPISHGPQDLWGYLHIINPNEFPSYWSFVHKWCHTAKSPFHEGLDIIGPKNPSDLRNMLSNYMLRRKKADVLQDLPDKIRQAVYVDMKQEHRDMYNQLAKKMILELDDKGDHLTVANALAKTTRLRQLCLSPALIGSDDWRSEVLNVVVDLVKTTEDKSVIFTPFAAAIPIIEKALKLDMVPCVKLHGEMRDEERRDNLKRFKSASFDGTLICTIGLGASWSVSEVTNTCIFAGYDWSPGALLQCEDRLHRFGQKKCVNVYYVLNRDTIDEHVMDILDRKNSFANILLKPNFLLAL